MPKRGTLEKTVAMVGMMGAGKSAVGSAVAGILEVPFLDTDAEIERAADASVAEIFARDGEAFFRAREADVLARLMTGPPVILSTGGGVYMSERNRRVVSERGMALWLRADLDLLWSRVRHKTTRPLLRVPDPRARLAELLAQRAPAYARAELVVDAHPDLSVEAMAHRVVDRLGARPDVFRERV